VADLYLAHGCAIGAPRAVAIFEEQHRATLAGVARRFAGDSASLDDMTQLLREHFLVPRGERAPRIADYRGNGPLEGWLRVAAVRRLVDDRRRAKRKNQEAPREDDLLERLADDGSWELGFLKARYRDAFRRAFSEAVLLLTSEQRNFLRYQSVQGLTLDQIGALHGLHRSSVDRRIQAARRVLLDETRLALGAVLDARPEEVDSVMRLIGSQLDASLSRLLKRSISAAPPARSSNANST
jgi:RNA polymerase sigma-70 factor (ECF subfamily)